MTKSIVIIDDDTWQASHLERVLRRAGYKTSQVNSGRAAIDVIDDEQPDLVILDLLLGDATAFALLHELQSHHDLARLPVLLITNVADRLDGVRLEEYGVVQVLDKLAIEPQDVVIAARKALA